MTFCSTLIFYTSFLGKNIHAAHSTQTKDGILAIQLIRNLKESTLLRDAKL